MRWRRKSWTAFVLAGQSGQCVYHGMPADSRPGELVAPPPPHHHTQTRTLATQTQTNTEKDSWWSIFNG